MKFQKRKQLSVYLENRVGALDQICRIIKDKSINIIGICAIDTVEEAVLRIVAEDSDAAKVALEAHDFKVIDTDVFVIDLENTPGTTGTVATILHDANINIDYIYASAHPGENRALLILRTHQVDETEKALTKNNQESVI